MNEIIMTRPKQWMSLKEACEELGVSVSTFRKWMARGCAPRTKRLPNGSLRTNSEWLEAWMENLP